MSPRTILIVILALVLGGSAAVGINSMRNQEPPPPPPKPETVPVLVAATEISPFALITPEMVKPYDCPKDLVPADAITKLEDIQDRAVKNLIVTGELLLGAKLAPRGTGRGMASKVPKGKRAFTINTPTVDVGVAGFILPGNKVDVLLTIDLPAIPMSDPPSSKDEASKKADPLLTLERRLDLGGRTSTVHLLQNVEILAIEQRVVAPVEGKVNPAELKSVTLLATPQETARLTLAQSKGRLCLTLRGYDLALAQWCSQGGVFGLFGLCLEQQGYDYGDSERAVTQPVHLSEIMGLGEQPRPQPAPPAGPLPIRMLSGTQEGVFMLQPASPGR